MAARLVSSLPIALSRKYENLRRMLEDLDHVAVAFSGGVDSTLLLKVAMDTLGEQAAAVHGTSILQPPEEQENTRVLAHTLGCRLEICQLDPLSWPEFITNPPDRCYHCKKRIYTLFLTRTVALQIPHLLDGTNADDLNDIRPGMKALQEFGIKMPLAEAGLSKQEVRLLSRELHLSTWQQASSSCLATRIPTGTRISKERLGTVERAERFLGTLGFKGCRVRLASGDSVCLELIQGEIGRLMSDSLRSTVVDFFLSIGIEKVFLDLSERDGIVI